MRRSLYLYSILGAGLFSCTPDPVVKSDPGNFQMDFEFYVDSDTLQFHDVFYTNGAGNEYRVSRLQYFISGVTLFKEGQKKYEQTTEPQSVNAEWPDTRRVFLDDVPAGSYDSIHFAYGVVPEYNYTYAFPLSNEDLHMYWSPSMGGGYHHMKMEGYWRDGIEYGGYAFHIGYNGFLLRVGLPIQIEIPEGGTDGVVLAMNVNEWFDNPHTFNLLDGIGYTMGDTTLMGYLLENGSHAFTVQP